MLAGVDPTPDRFAALARSAPWRWSALRFVLRTDLHGRTSAVRAHVVRPDRLRVETLDGRVLADGREPPSTDLPAAPVAFDADGLVASPRPSPERFAHDAPFFRDYRWVAVLDPAELGDGVTVADVTAVLHHGRPAWEAVLRTTPANDPRCSCCPLLLSADSDAHEVAGGAPPITERVPGLRFADAHRVRLDVGTGVCVLTAEIGGDRPGEGHDLAIEAAEPYRSPDAASGS